MGVLDQIIQILKANNGYARTKDILAAGIHHYYLSKLVKKGKVEKVKRGMYRLTQSTIDYEIEEVHHLVPQGVVSMFSAWSYYELSDFVPPEHHIAIEKSKKVSLPDYPPIKLYYWSEKYWKIGIRKIQIGDTAMHIYEKEKAVCDAIKFRNKIGKETEKEVLKNYLKSKDRNINQLLYYAELLRVEKRLKTYLNIML